MSSTIRTPSVQDSKDCAALIYMSGPNLFNFMTCLSQHDLYTFFQHFFDKPNNPYSQNNIWVEESKGEIRGLILCYAIKDTIEMSRNMQKNFKEFFKQMGFCKVIHMMSRMPFNLYLPKMKKDEYFVSTLSVFERFQGRGIGRKLLQHAESLAREKGFKKLSICVETSNPRARRIYDEFGFREEKKVVLSKRFNEHNLFGFVKMVKLI